MFGIIPFFHGYHAYFADDRYQKKVSLRSLKKWLGGQFVLSSSQEADLAAVNLESPSAVVEQQAEVEVTRRSTALSDFSLPGEVNLVHECGSWFDYVIRAFIPLHPLKVDGKMKIDALDFLRATWPMVGRSQHETIMRGLEQLKPMQETLRVPWMPIDTEGDGAVRGCMCVQTGGCTTQRGYGSTAQTCTPGRSSESWG